MFLAALALMASYPVPAAQAPVTSIPVTALPAAVPAKVDDTAALVASPDALAAAMPSADQPALDSKATVTETAKPAANKKGFFKSILSGITTVLGLSLLI